MVAGKAKGSAWEREVSRILTEWLTGQRKELYYYRSPGSGAVATINLGNKAISGDIIALKQEAKFFTDIFNIEAKAGYENASFDKFLKMNKNDPLESFWNQSIRDAEIAEKYPLVIFKKKGMPNPWIGFNKTTYNKLYKYINKCRIQILQWRKRVRWYMFYEFIRFFRFNKAWADKKRI